MTIRPAPLFYLLCALAPAPAGAGGEIAGTAADDTLVGTEQGDSIVGAAGDDLLQGGEGDDELRGGSGDDVLIGGAGADRLFGGPGADRFVFDLDALAETDEILDFEPEEGDTVWLQLGKSVKPTKKLAGGLEFGDATVKHNRVTVDNVRLDFDGDVEVRFEGDSWVKVAKIKRSDLKLKVSKRGSNLRLIFSRKF